MKLTKTTTTKEYKYDGGTIIQTSIKQKGFDPIYFSNPSSSVEHWDIGGGYIDLAPKGNFITKFVKRLWNVKKLMQLLK